MYPHVQLGVESMLNFSPMQEQSFLSPFEPVNNWQYLSSIINFQNILNMELLKNQNLIENYMIESQKQTNDKVTEKSMNSSPESASKFRVPKFQNYSISDLKNNISKKQKYSDTGAAENSSSFTERKTRKPKGDQSYSEYQPQNSYTENLKITKSSQSKNVPKNFSKAILLFINKKQNLVKKLAAQEGADFEEFKQMITNLKGKINTIAELRSLWLQEENKYAKMFRILSSLYLRKYAMEHIFNSRIQNFSRHLKYRQKLSQVIRNPKEFTRMKDY